MKKILFITFLFFGLILPIQTFAAPSQPTIPLSMGQSPGNGGSDKDEDDKSSKNKKIPSAPVHCVVDFENRCITGSFSSELISYEVWNEDGDLCLATFTNDSDLVDYLYYNDGTYQLRFYSTSYVYTGYISLQ